VCECECECEYVCTRQSRRARKHNNPHTHSLTHSFTQPTHTHTLSLTHSLTHSFNPHTAQQHNISKKPTSGKVGFSKDFAEHQCRDRSAIRWLQHKRTSRRYRRSNLVRLLVCVFHVCMCECVSESVRRQTSKFASINTTLTSQ
jgi:hypothetical protein